MSYKTTNHSTARLKSAGGLCGIVALSDSAGHVFSAADWAECLAEPEKLQRDPQEVLKREGENSVIVKTVKVGSAEVKAVIKTRLEKRCPFSLRSGRAIRNFQKAVFLKNANLPVEIPLVALRQKKNIFSEKSVYITEYVPQSANLHWFVKRDLPLLTDQAAAKKQLAYELAHILADLHNNSFLHRDAKPSNFLVFTGLDGRPNPMLIDLDGLRRYCGVRTFGRRFRPFAHLAVLRSVSPFVYTTDCLRTFTIYCNLTGVEKAERKRFFRRLANGLAAKRIESLAAKGRA